MKLQIDTTGKIIKVEGSVSLKELIDTLEKLLPKGVWKEFELESTVIQNWSTPIVIEKSTPYYPAPIWWFSDETKPRPYEITCENKHYCLNEGTYNIQC